MNFSIRKQNQLIKGDKSDIGSWDKHILALCEKINKNKKYYTTSSCSGRIVLILDNDKKKAGLFLFRSHEKLKLGELMKELEKARREGKKVYFKQEPCILHVAANSLEDAQKFLDKAKLAGWKNSGIMASSDRFVIEMRSTEKLELPIIDHGEILVDNNYLKILLAEANLKLERTWEKIKKLEKLL
jgi:tRNA wybutosine-synthesizing protein 3